MIHRITAPNDASTGRLAEGVAIILGEAFTTNDRVADWARERGYVVETAEEIPAEHTARLARLTAWPHPISLSVADGADPDQRYRFTGPDGHTQIDIRDVLSGVVTA